ncbi:hypothetical protein T4B_2508 [Trichinella pseudospiralis]|uniref:Uncharacterized protein n=1 Tax=Trichinella pseudospiralis TaxID=6337 RepID=A0A0V1J2D2_TRIPS|nr:hypothetical protein T4B_2508 [Trichinella pseudospiralis]KRZ40504.1 hypothetical protein T4C_4976 [Trichinella pseudospiralis]
MLISLTTHFMIYGCKEEQKLFYSQLKFLVLLMIVKQATMPSVGNAGIVLLCFSTEITSLIILALALIKIVVPLILSSTTVCLNLSTKIRPDFCDWLFADRLYGG